MEIKLDYTKRRILQKNIFYILSYIGLFICLTASLIFFTQQYQKAQESIQTTKKEIIDLNKKKALITYKNQVVQNEIDLDKINKIFSQLIPQEEDFFSIIVALEKLSEKSKFIITNYNILVAGSKQNMLALVVEGDGDKDTFLEFLKDYNFTGGRLITIDKIDYNPKSFSGSKINLNLYSGAGKGAEPLSSLSEADKQLVRKIMEKVEIQLTPESDEVVDYPTKQNPF